jgi:hypothetical protein
MNYTIFTREQVSPKILPSGALNMGQPPVYPSGGGLIFSPATLDIYSPDPAQRKELVSDPNGSATLAEVDAALPTFRDWRALLIRIEGEKRLKTLVGHYLPAERETWPYQREEAMRWKSGGMQSTPFCDRISGKRGKEREAFLQAVIDNTDLYSANAADIIGEQQAILDRIYAAATVAAALAEAW